MFLILFTKHDAIDIADPSSEQDACHHREPAESVCVANRYFVVNVLDLPFASTIAICC